jgi:sugar lactone lactonase YvrE
MLGSNDGTGSAARFAWPQGVAVDGSGTVYVADTGNVTIRKVTPAGVVSTLAGTAGYLGNSDGTGAAAHFNTPANLATDAAGNIYVTDRENHILRKVTPTGTVTTVAGTAGSATVVSGLLPGRLSFPQGIAVTPAGDLVVTSSNGLVQATAF